MKQDKKETEELELDPMYTPETRAQSFRLAVYSWLQPLLFALVFLILLSTFAGRIIGVDGSSMFPTLHDHDMLVLQSLAYKPAQGDIVVLTQRSFSDKPIVKRVIATEGQTVDIDFDAGVVRVDGTALTEPYIREDTHLDLGTEYPFTVPEGCVFLMGDNRNESRDSREPPLGAVDTRCVIGRAVFLLLPGMTEDLGMREWDRIGSL